MKGWNDAAVDLADWRGQNVVFELISDSLGLNTRPYSLWADVILVRPPAQRRQP